jgi:hypothetical protein
MLEKIETREIMTAWDAVMKYRTKYFIMLITETVDQGDNDIGYVIYTANTERELSKAPKDDYLGKKAAFKIGYAAEPYPQITNIIYHV